MPAVVKLPDIADYRHQGGHGRSDHSNQRLDIVPASVGTIFFEFGAMCPQGNDNLRVLFHQQLPGVPTDVFVAANSGRCTGSGSYQIVRH